ncbi:MAG: PAP2 family protein [Bacteroidia bacterium]
MNFSTLFAKIISYLFHPLLMPMLGLFLVFNLGSMGLWMSNRPAIYLLTFIATFLLPLTVALLLLRMKYISSLEMQTKEERKLPYLATAVFYYAEFYFLMNSDVPALVKALMLGATLLVVSALLINLFWKVSAHMVGIGGICGMMIAVSYRLQMDLNYMLIPLFLIAGLVGYARLKLSSHSPAQVYAGFLVGVAMEVFLFGYEIFHVSGRG